MKSKLLINFKEKTGDYIFPFLWLHGESEDVLRQYVRVIYNANLRSFCVESRPHPDFAGPGWWHDMDIILNEAAKHAMRVWILDDSHFPTGFANSAVPSTTGKTRYTIGYRLHVTDR